MGHQYFTDVILPRSYTYDHDPALKKNSYWKVIFYISIIETYGHQFPIIARNSLNGILDTEKYTAKTIAHDSLQYDSQMDFNTLLLNYFNEFVQNQILDDTIVNKYNIDVYRNNNVYKLVLINFCKIILKLYKSPLKYLFDRDIIYVTDTDNYYVLTCNPNEFFTSIYVKKPQHKQNTSSYDYLNLMVDNNKIKNAIIDNEW